MTGPAPLTFPDPEPWATEGLCNYLLEPDAWFDIGRHGDHKLHTRAREAVRVCQSCPVQVECLEHALEHREKHGVWGGLTPYERERVKDRAKRRVYRQRKKETA